jgi:hypothetical protein
MQSGSVQTKHKIQIPFGQIEYTGAFKVPIVKSLSPPSEMVEALLRALKPYGFSIDGVEIRNREKVSEFVLEFRSTPPLISFKVSPGKVSITADNLDWSGKDKFLESMNAGLRVVLGLEHTELESQQMILAMHVQLQDTPRKDITAPLLSATAYELLTGESEFQGMVLTRVGVSVVIDASLAHANALFMRLVRQHKSTATLEQIASQLYADEAHIFEVLNLDGEL